MLKNKNVKTCPICSKSVLSDAELVEYCGLCGMGIVNPTKVPNLRFVNGKKLYFCSGFCLSIYKNEININSNM